MLPATSIENLPATSPVTIRRLKSLGIKTYWDLLNFFPFRYEDYSLISPVEKLQEGEVVTVTGTIIKGENLVVRKGLIIQKFLIEDKTGQLELNWYNQPYLLQLLKPKLTVSVAGEIKRFGQKLVMDPIEYELGKSQIHTGRIIPVYPEKKGLSSRTIREKVFYILTHPNNNRTKNETWQINKNINKNGKTCHGMSLKEIFPPEIISYNNLIDQFSAYQNIHFPKSRQLAKKARERLAFDELFFLQLNAALIKREWEKETVGHQFKLNPDHAKALQQFINNLPFQLTNSQKKVWGEILSDLQQQKPMNRLLQGDVGSGKTVVAALACYLAYLNGFQSLLMAPTEILAFQHYHTITNLFKNYPVKIAIHTGSKKISNIEYQISNIDIIIGTHALIQKKISFERVGLVIIDEQHRFGVAQRAMLKEKGINPHLLTMTATPIPRTVALTLYGQLDISVIEEMPKGRLPVKTFIVPKSKRANCYQWIKSQIISNQAQVFIICPLIEESNVETMKSIKAAKKEFIFLKEKIFPEFSLGLIHGKMKAKEKEKIMKDFKDKKYQILVATPVVEVGIDVESATIMIIEAAERFGLAQLHQLRGRVGRGDKQAYCFLFSTVDNSEAIERLKLFSKIRDGNLLAEKDLQIRGPGNVYGTQQHGIIQLKIATLSDFSLIEKTKNAVKYFISKYDIKNFKVTEERLREYKIDQIAKD
ncbi:MAG: ATP-dependent DNA helicase RecG [Microgenomates group bacterium]